jgi:hypothetical protein
MIQNLVQRLSNCVIARAEKDQWLPIPHNHLFHFRNENGVIAGVARVLQPALKVGQRSMQNRRPLRCAIKARTSLLST